MTTVMDIFNYGSALLMVLFGIYTITAAGNLIRKVIGMVVMQTGVILFFISLAFKADATIPVLPAVPHEVPHAFQYTNPLPHALMLTAIVVGVSLLGVALVLITTLYRSQGSLEEDEIVEKLRELK